MVALASFAHWYLDHDMNRITRYAILTLTYTSNVSTFWTDGTGPFGNTWSLACEEQFYIIWSLLLPLILARGTQIRSVIVTSLVILLIAMQAWIGMFDLWQMNWRFGFWSNVWKMLFGASLRLISIPEWVKKRSTSYIGLVGFISILLLAYQDQPSYDHIAKGWKEAIRPTLLWADFLTATSTSLILCSVSAPKGGNWLLEGSLVRFLGRVSYAWYLWQVPILELIGWKRGWLGFWSTAVAFCIAMISTIYIEEPINIGWKNWKHRRDQKRESASPA